MRRPFFFLLLLAPCSALATAIVPLFEHIDPIARNHAVRPVGNLADYASAPSPSPKKAESFAEASRRILAGTQATKDTPEATAVLLEEFAATAVTSPDHNYQLAGHRARYHAHRIVAAIHYNLFLRSQKLAELVAATYREKAAVIAFRDFLNAAEASRHPSATAFRSDLKKLEHSLQDLEAQCCPPDEAVLREPTWQPAFPLPRSLRKT